LRQTRSCDATKDYSRSPEQKAPRERGFLLYLLIPDPGPVGVNVEPLGDELGPTVLPEGFIVELDPLAEPGVVPVVLPLPLMVLPLPLPVVPEAALPPAVPPLAPPAPPACANAKVEEKAIPVANAIVVSFIVLLPGFSC
jgi:hypothetical protein